MREGFYEAFRNPNISWLLEPEDVKETLIEKVMSQLSNGRCEGIFPSEKEQHPKQSRACQAIDLWTSVWNVWKNANLSILSVSSKSSLGGEDWRWWE